MRHESEQEANNGVDAPGVEAPVVEGDEHRLLGQLVVRERVVRCEPVWADVVVDGLSHAVEEDPGSHPAGK